MTDVLRIRRRLAGVGTAGAPASLMTAELAFNENDSTLYYGRGDNGSQQAVTIIPIAGAGYGAVASVNISDAAPASPSPGNLWWNSSSGVGQLYIYFNDGSSSQWVIANNASGGLYLPLTGGTVTGLVTFNLAQTTNPAIILADSGGNGRIRIGGVATIAGNNTGALTITATPGTTHTGNLTIQGTTTLAAATGVTMATADSSTNLATTAFVKNQAYLPLAGGTMTGVITSSSAGNFGNSTIGGVTISGGAISGAGSCTFSGNVIGSNSVQSGGVYFQNVSGCFYSPQSFYTAGVVYVGNTAIYWQNQSNWMYTNANMYSAGAVGVGGSTSIYWNNNGGWMYCPVGVWCNNINTNAIQCNGANISGTNQVAFSQGTIGGYGSINFGWANGNWWGAQSSDAFYTYVNQGMAGGIYWSFCDERMKWDFRPVTRDCLAAINAIELQGFDFSEGPAPQRRLNPEETRPEFFRWEDLPRKVKHIETGFIAQQLREHIPEAVPDPPEEGFYLSVDMRPLVATLIGAVQQLTKQNAAQMARIEALEAR